LQDELLDVVDDADVVTTQALRSTVHERGLQHRGVHVLLFTPDGNLLIQKRSANRRQYASLLDCSVSEHVKAGESYQEAAQRGLLEELGVNNTTVQPLVKFKMNYGQNDNEISVVYKGSTRSPEIFTDHDEIDSVQWLSMDELKNLMEMQNPKFTDWFLEIMQWYWGKSSALTVLQKWQDNSEQIDI
jgi:isopentenyl-diphosphate delta-isomerase type 1